MSKNIEFSISEHEESIKQIVVEGKKYIENNIPDRTPIYNIILEQLKYISPTLWLLQLVGVISMIIVFNIRQYSIENIKNILYIISPIISVITVPEIMKNYFFGIYEIESTCKNSNAKIFLTRLVLIGFINIFSLLILTVTACIKFKLALLDLVVYSFLPFNFINIIILLLIDAFKIKNHYVCLIVSLVSLSFVVFIIPNIILKNINNFISIILLVLTTTILIFQILTRIKIIKRKGIEKYEFNFE